MMATTTTDAISGPARVARLAVIALLAGVFSGLFGVGGGTVIVPLLILWLGYDTRVATGTSLAAIALIATGAMLSHSAYGNLHVDKGLLVGLPAIVGVLIGTAAQQRLPRSTIKLFFAGLLLLIAVAMAVDL